MSYSKFFQGIAIGMAAFALFWLYDSLLRQNENKDNISESWNNVGKYLTKAVKDYEKNMQEKV